MSRLKLLQLTAVALSVAPTVFGAQRTFVASYGVDSNPCTVAAPCRSFPAAIAITDAGGEIIVLDSAGYGSFAASQSVSVLAPSGIHAVRNGTDGFDVLSSPGAATMTVSRAVVSLNTWGISSSGSGAIAIVTASTVEKNRQFGLYQSGGGILRTLQNNTVELNGISDTTGIISSGTLQ